MKCRVFWIESIKKGALGTMARPRSGEWLHDDLLSLKKQGVSTLTCMLDRDEIVELGLQEEKAICEQLGLAYLSYPVPDFGIPEDIILFKKLTQDLAKRVQQGQKVAVHCRAGIGRSSLTVASTMLHLGFSASDAFAHITKARGVKVPDTREQMEWVMRL